MDVTELRDEEHDRWHFSAFSLHFLKGQSVKDVGSDIRYLVPWIKPYRTRLWFALALFLISTLATLSIPRLVAFTVDKSLLTETQNFWSLWAIIGSLAIIKITCDLRFKWVVTKSGQNMTTQLRRDLFTELHKRPMSFYDTNSSGRLISRCVSDVSNLAAFFTANFFSLVSDTLIIIGAIIMLSTLVPWAALAIFLLLMVMCVYMINVTLAQISWGRELRHLMSRMSSHTADTMNNLSVLHSQPYGNTWMERFGKLQRMHGKMTTRSIMTWGTFSSSHVIFLGVGYAMALGAGIYGIESKSLSLGGFIAVSSYVMMIFHPFFDISEKLNVILTALGSVRRLQELLPAPPMEETSKGAEDTIAPQGPISFENLTFAYGTNKPIFQDFNLEFPEGETIALVGRTGSGKTTLASLLLQLYPLKRGQILWGDKDIAKLTPTHRANLIGMVGQDLFFFADTLRENLRLYREHITDDKIYKVLKAMGMDEKVKALPQGLDSVVRAESLPFSQGERQLLVIGRVMLKDPKLLVFDEATANLDQWSEEQIMQRLGELFRGRTTLFIAHRLTTLRLAHRVIVMEQGKIKKIITKTVGTPISEQELH